jgi:hypothetical protein
MALQFGHFSTGAFSSLLKADGWCFWRREASLAAYHMEAATSRLHQRAGMPGAPAELTRNLRTGQITLV